MSNKFQLLEFSLDKLVINPAIVMIAKRGSGKSYITRDIIYNYRKIPGGVAIVPTDGLNPFYKYFFPDIYIHYDITPALLRRILVRQGEMIDKSKAKKKEGKKVDPRSLLVMDDCLSRKKSWGKDDTILEILMNGRHYQLTYILTMQTPLGITPDLRLNFDYVFLLKEDSTTNKKKLYENYASMFPSLYVFEAVFKKCTENYQCMVIDNRKPSDDIKEKVFWYKAKDRTFTFGSKKFVSIHKKYYDPEYAKKKRLELTNCLDVFKKKKNEVDVKIEMV